MHAHTYIRTKECVKHLIIVNYWCIIIHVHRTNHGIDHSTDLNPFVWTMDKKAININILSPRRPPSINGVHYSIESSVRSSRTFTRPA